MLHTILDLILDTPLDGVNCNSNMAGTYANVVLRLVGGGLGAVAEFGWRVPGFGRGFKTSEFAHCCTYCRLRSGITGYAALVPCRLAPHH